MGVDPRDVIIPETECIDRNAYRISSRNLLVGVFVASKRGFVGIREKFDSRFLFTEYHRDIGPPLGTATPFRDLGKCPIEDLSEYGPPLVFQEGDLNADGEPIDWLKPGDPYRIRNQQLFKWLEAKEEEIAEPCPGCGKPHWPVPWSVDNYCMRTACYDARCKPCPVCSNKVLDSDGSQVCVRCSDPLAYDLRMVRAMEQVRLEQERRRQATSG